MPNAMIAGDAVDWPAIMNYVCKDEETHRYV